MAVAVMRPFICFAYETPGRDVRESIVCYITSLTTNVNTTRHIANVLRVDIHTLCRFYSLFCAAARTPATSILDRHVKMCHGHLD